MPGIAYYAQNYARLIGAALAIVLLQVHCNPQYVPQLFWAIDTRLEGGDRAKLETYIIAYCISYPTLNHWIYM